MLRSVRLMFDFSSLLLSSSFFAVVLYIILSLDRWKQYSGHQCNNMAVTFTNTNANVIPSRTTTFVVPNVIIIIGLILITVPNRNL